MPFTPADRPGARKSQDQHKYALHAELLYGKGELQETGSSEPALQSASQFGFLPTEQSVKQGSYLKRKGSDRFHGQMEVRLQTPNQHKLGSLKLTGF